MANVIIANVTYSDVPAVDISKVGGGTARFYDDSGTITITQNGTHDVKGKGSAVVNVQGGVTPTGNIALASGITDQTGIDVSAYATASISKIASGTAGTPTATKGTVSNNSVTVTPSVTNTTGYITGGTKTGTAVTVSASELVSGTKSITANGTGIDVKNYASVNVSVPSTPTQTKSATYNANGSYTVTPDSGYAMSSVSVTVAIPTYDGSVT